VSRVGHHQMESSPVSTHGRRPGTFKPMGTGLIEPITARLALRQWRDDDRVAFAALNTDPLVMEHFPAILSREQSDAMVDRCVEHIERNGYGLWAVAVRTTGQLIGFVGLAVPTWEAAFTPCTEIGWRLARSAWGLGYATEAATAALATAFGPVGLDEVVSFTTTGNLRSQHVMQRLGMTRDPSEDFDHPRVADGPLRRHVLYRISRSGWDRRESRRSAPAPSPGLAPRRQPH
jgi:RimJ/RimL family protein N-acetyltransferase